MINCPFFSHRGTERKENYHHIIPVTNFSRCVPVPLCEKNPFSRAVSRNEMKGACPHLLPSTTIYPLRVYTWNHVVFKYVKPDAQRLLKQ
jgi:hypothetical protein